MARRPTSSVEHPTLEYLAHPGPHRVAVGDLSYAGMKGIVYGPVSGRGLAAVALGRGWLQPAYRYVGTLKYLASWGIVAVAPETERSPFPSHAGMARDLSRALRLLAAGRLAGGVITVDPKKMGLIGHSIGGGAVTLAAAADSAVKAVVTVTAAETRPSAIRAAGNVLVPGLHLVGTKDLLGGREGAAIAKAWAGPSQLRVVKGAKHLGLAEGRHWTTAVVGNGAEKRIQHATRILAAAFLLRHLDGQEHLAEELEGKVSGTQLEPTGEPLEPGQGAASTAPGHGMRALESAQDSATTLAIRSAT